MMVRLYEAQNLLGDKLVLHLNQIFLKCDIESREKRNHGVGDKDQVDVPFAMLDVTRLQKDHHEQDHIHQDEDAD